jgi:hypothetical protein
MATLTLQLELSAYQILRLQEEAAAKKVTLEKVVETLLTDYLSRQVEQSANRALLADLYAELRRQRKEENNT